MTNNCKSLKNNPIYDSINNPDHINSIQVMQIHIQTRFVSKNKTKKIYVFFFKQNVSVYVFAKTIDNFELNI